MLNILSIGIALFFGFLSNMIKLPIMTGFIISGFVFKALKPEGIDATLIAHFTDFGLDLLLFNIGLKLNISYLKNKQNILAVLVQTFIFGSIAFFLTSFIAPGYSQNQILIIALAMTFSSTVFVFKGLQDKGELFSVFGQISLSILIIQDLISVGFMSVTESVKPSYYILFVLIALPLIKKIQHQIMNDIKSKELFTLVGVFFAIGGAELFELFHIKGDLGAILFGYFCADHIRANELKKLLTPFQNFFLIAFFFSIGLNGVITPEYLLIAAGLTLLIPIKSLLYYFTLKPLGVKKRESFFAATALSNYSEFGLIIISFSISEGFLSAEWMSIFAFALCFSFILSSIINENKLLIFQKLIKAPVQTSKSFSSMNAVVIGLGRIGSSTLESLSQISHWNILGVDILDTEIKHGAKVSLKKANALDTSFWQKFNFEEDYLKVVILCLPKNSLNCEVAEILRSSGYNNKIISISRFASEKEELIDSGVDEVFNVFDESGHGLALTVSEINLKSEASH
jgi:glutathione-regulated potassium-efflux system ancillary protein KefC